MGLLTIALLVFLTSVLEAQSTSHGVQLFESGNWTAAKAELSAVLQRNPNDAGAHHYMARLALLDDDPELAAKHSEQAVQLDDRNSGYQLWYAKALGQQLGHVSMFERPLYARRALSALERAVALDSRNLDARDGLVDFYSAVPPAMGGGPDKVRDQVNAISAINEMRGHLALGRLAVRAKDASASERELNTAISMAPDTLRLYVTLANWYSTQKQWSKAFATIDRYTARRPTDAYGAYQIGRIAAASGLELPRGEAAIRRFIAQPPKDLSAATRSMAYLRLGQVLKQQGQSKDATAVFQQALTIDPRNEEAKKALEDAS